MITVAQLLPHLTQPRSAHDLARLVKCTVAQVLEVRSVSGSGWWEISCEAGPAGLLYRKRDVLAKAIVRPMPRYTDAYQPTKSGYGRNHREVV